MKYSEHFTRLLRSLGYTHCFFVPGGNSMHLLDAARREMTCVPFIHEGSAAIAAEYFNEISTTGRAYCLVTAGPGLTNALTAVSGAFLESRELLLIGGQVKSADLSRGAIRQRGIQEVDGVAVVSPVCKTTLRLENVPLDDVVFSAIASGQTPRRGPVFIEICLDVQAQPVAQTELPEFGTERTLIATAASDETLRHIQQQLIAAERPVLLLGGGVDYAVAHSLSGALADLAIPIMTTWNGADRIADDHPCFAGRPNTWGQRSANILLAQADLVIALGTRLGLQQTGFNWGEWGRGHVIHVDIDEAELAKGHPRVDTAIQADANGVLRAITAMTVPDLTPWRERCRMVRDMVPVSDPMNKTAEGFCSPFTLVDELSMELDERDVLVPASSGSGQFVPMMMFRNRASQRILTNKGSASMGYGLAGAIGASLAAGPGRRTFLIEGDGSFSQNLQELGTVVAQRLNLKIFLLDNDGYASIRTTQRNYFGGEYLGCDTKTGLGLPDWHALARAFGVPSVDVDARGLQSAGVAELLHNDAPAFFVVRVDPEQTYFPKVSSRVRADGSMESNPIHRMSPDLPEEVWKQVWG